MSKRSKEESRAAKDHVYSVNGRLPCPYEAETRPARHWHKWRSHYMNMESAFDDLANVYGEFRPYVSNAPSLWQEVSGD